LQTTISSLKQQADMLTSEYQLLMTVFQIVPDLKKTVDEIKVELKNLSIDELKNDIKKAEALFQQMNDSIVFVQNLYNETILNITIVSNKTLESLIFLNQSLWNKTDSIELSLKDMEKNITIMQNNMSDFVKQLNDVENQISNLQVKIYIQRLMLNNAPACFTNMSNCSGIKPFNGYCCWDKNLDFNNCTFYFEKPNGANRLLSTFVMKFILKLALAATVIYVSPESQMKEVF